MESVVPKQINNQEALLDVLAMQSLRQRQGAQKQASFTMTSDIDELVQSFTIDDSIAECFAPSDKNSKGGKFKKNVNKEREGSVNIFRHYGKKHPWKNSNNSLSSNSVNNGSKKLLTVGVFQRKAKKPTSPRNLPSGSPFKMATQSTSSLDINSRETSFKLNSSTLLCTDALKFAPQNKSDQSLNGTVQVSPELRPVTHKNVIATRKYEPISNENHDFVTCDVSKQCTRPTNETVMDNLKQAIKLDNEKQLKILLSEIHPSNDGLSINNFIELVSMAAHLGQDSCLLTLLEHLSSATHVTSRDRHTIARAASQEAVRTDHVMCLQSLVSEGFSIWEDQHPTIIEESRRCGSVVCYHYMILLHVLALTWGKSTGNASLNDILKSVYKQSESSDSDINKVILNVLEQHEFNVDEKQTAKSQQKILMEEEYVSLSHQDGQRTRNTETEGCRICTFNPCVCEKHETRKKSHKSAAVDKTLYPPRRDAVIKDRQKVVRFDANDTASVSVKSSEVSTHYLTDSNNNNSQKPVGSSDQSLIDSNKTLPETSVDLSEKSLPSDISMTITKTSGLSKQILLTDKPSTKPKIEGLSDSSLATYMNVSLPPNSKGLSNQYTDTRRNCDSEGILISTQPLREYPTEEGLNDRHEQATNIHSVEILYPETSASNSQLDAAKNHGNSADDEHVIPQNCKSSNITSKDVDRANSVPSSDNSNESYWSESQSLLITGNAFTDCTSDSQSFPSISEWCSSTSNVTSFCSDDDESSYYSEDDGNYNAVVLNLEDEELDPEQLSEQRLRKHLDSTRRQMYHNSDFVETVITANGQRISENGNVVEASLQETVAGSKGVAKQDGRGQILMTQQTPKDRVGSGSEDKRKKDKRTGCVAGSAPDRLSETASTANGQHSDGLHRDTQFRDTGHADWNCRPWYEVSDDDSLCLNRSNDSDSDTMPW